MKSLMETIVSCKLKDICVPWTDYSFNQVKHASTSKPLMSDLGEVSRHICNSHQSKAEITLSKLALDYFKTSPITTSKISSRNIVLHCQDLQYNLHLNFPVDYSSLKVTHKSEIFLLISCQRQPYSFKEERPCFIATPDHTVSLPVYTLNPSYMTSHGNIQITDEDRAVYNTKQLTRRSAAPLGMADKYYENSCSLSLSFRLSHLFSLFKLQVVPVTV